MPKRASRLGAHQSRSGCMRWGATPHVTFFEWVDLGRGRARTWSASRTVTSKMLEPRLRGLWRCVDARIDMAEVDGSSPFAPARFDRKNKHFAETLGTFFRDGAGRWVRERRVTGHGAPGKNQRQPVN